MGPLAILSILSVVGPLLGGVVRVEEAERDSRTRLETVKVLETYRYGPHTPAHRRATEAAPIFGVAWLAVQIAYRITHWLPKPKD
jgi:hypothetical protein